MMNMINAFHLLWIVPLSASVGLFCAAMAAAAGKRDEYDQLRNLSGGDTPVRVHRALLALIWKKHK